MKGSWLRPAGILVLLSWGCLGAIVQSGGQPAGVEKLWGPVVGITCVVAPRGDFNDRLQRLYPNREREYWPVFTQFGVKFEQRIGLGTTRSHFIFQEVFTIGGIDQSIALPSFSSMLGFRSHSGLQLGLGPILVVRWTDAEVEAAVSVVYSVGWNFPFHGAYVPISIAAVPTPDDGYPMFGVFTGFDFVCKAKEKSRAAGSR